MKEYVQVIWINFSNNIIILTMENSKIFRNTEKFFYCFILSIGFGMLPSLSWAQEDGIISDQYGEKLGKIDKDGIISNKYGESQGKIDKDGIVYDKHG
ncbi:MAG: hypothetical protein M3Z67_02660 [Commensalibacter sp.]|nr:hypothetical protein [Commensalibacter sp.]